jgi:hypothetical protein
MWKLFAASLGLIASLAACAPLPAEFNRIDRGTGEGAVHEGGAFGIPIGATREEAQAIITRTHPQFRFIFSVCLKGDSHLAPDGDTYQHRFSPLSCPDKLGEDVYHASSGLTFANIDVISEKGRVIKIEWWSGKGDPFS